MSGLIPYMTVLMLSSYILVKLLCVLTDEAKVISVRLLAFLSIGVVGVTILCVILALIQLLFVIVGLMDANVY